MATRLQVIAEARSWIGTRCHHHAGLKGVGTDCGGMVRGVGAELGLEPTGWRAAAERFKGYGRRPAGGIVRESLALYADPIPLASAQPGDILLMQFAHETEPQHVGILTDLNGRPGLIHVYYQARKVAEHGIDETWRRRIVGAYQYRGIE
jgi:NlpC/P60 family putative phage cell wall peptidase